MGGNESKISDEDKQLKRFVVPGVRLNDVKNISRAFKLLDKNNSGYIMYDIGKITDSK
jgi:Ca2+-binding EF-hand superfamily protein